jgi:hypothetical protein
MRRPDGLSLTRLTITLAATGYLTQTPVLAQIPSAPTQVVPAEFREPIWEAVLAYHGRAILLAGRGDHADPYDPNWLRSIRERGLVRGVCPTAEPKQCPEDENSYYILLEDPVWGPDSTAEVEIRDTYINPKRCRNSPPMESGRMETWCGWLRHDTLRRNEYGDWRVERATESFQVLGGCRV